MKKESKRFKVCMGTKGEVRLVLNNEIRKITQYGMGVHYFREGEEIMELKERLSVVECVETLSYRLGELSNLITTIHLGLKAEKTEKQALDCMMCIQHSVSELHKLAEETLCEAREKTNATN